MTIRPWAAFVSLGLGFALTAIDSTIVAVANPDLMAAFDISLSRALWATNSYLVAYLAPMLVTGRLGDRFGVRRVYLVGLVILTLGALLSALAPEFWVLVFARALKGLGAAIMGPQALAMVTMVFAQRRLGRALSIWSAIAAVSTVCGPFVGGALVMAGGWSAVFWFGFWGSLISLIATIFFVSSAPATEARFDLFDALTLAVSIGALTWAVQSLGEAHARFAALVIVCATVLLMVVSARQRRSPDRIVPPELFRIPGFITGNIGVVALSVTVTALPILLMYWAQDVQHLDSLTAGALLVPLGLVAAIFSVPIGRLVDRGKGRQVAMLSLALAGIASLLTAGGIAIAAPIATLLVPISLFGLANAGAWSALTFLALAQVPASVSGAAASVYSTARQFGGLAGAAMVAMLAASLGGDATSATGLAVVLSVCSIPPVLAVAGIALAGLQVRSARARERKEL